MPNETSANKAEWLRKKYYFANVFLYEIVIKNLMIQVQWPHLVMIL